MARDPSDSGVGRLRIAETAGGRQWMAIDKQLTNLAFTLMGAPDAVVSARMAELHAQADLIEEPKWREMAHRHIELLPRDIGGPKPGSSPQYWEAAELVRRYIGREFDDPSEQATVGELVIEQVGALADGAPVEEQILIKGMSNAVVHKIDRVE